MTSQPEWSGCDVIGSKQPKYVLTNFSVNQNFALKFKLHQESLSEVYSVLAVHTTYYLRDSLYEKELMVLVVCNSRSLGISRTPNPNMGFPF